jgi:opacity protein-like surface antigen
MKRLLLALIVLVPALVIVSAAFAADAIIGCKESHRNYDDLIMFPGQPGASHQHVYAGARSNNAFSTVASMRASGTTCDDPRDLAGYWGPTFVAGYPIHPNKGALFYYTFNGTRGFPAGLRMIVRWTTPGNRVLFKCGPGSNPETRTPPASCSSGMLVPVVTFPQWWDGRLDSPDHLSHMSYSQTSTHNRRLPKLKVYWRIAVPAGAPINSNLSSGNYTTFHLDFFSTGEIR